MMPFFDIAQFLEKDALNAPVLHRMDGAALVFEARGRMENAVTCTFLDGDLFNCPCCGCPIRRKSSKGGHTGELSCCLLALGANMCPSATTAQPEAVPELWQSS